MRAIFTVLAALSMVAILRADPKSDARAALALSAASTITLPIGSTDALEEVNALRARHGLPAFQRDDALTLAAARCADFRAGRLLFGHSSNDFQFLPSGCSADAAGCAAYPAADGWLSCCMFDRYTYGGAAFAVGTDGKRYMHLFVRNAQPAKKAQDCKECAPAKPAVAETYTYTRQLTLLETLRERRIERLRALQARSFSRPLLIDRPLLRFRLFGGCCQ